MATRIDQVINDFFISFGLDDELHEEKVNMLLKSVADAFSFIQVDVWRYWPGKLRVVCAYSSKPDFSSVHQNTYLSISGMDFAQLMSMYGHDHVGDGKFRVFEHIYDGELMHYGMFGKEAFYGMVCFHTIKGYAWSEEEYEAIQKCGRALFHFILSKNQDDEMNKKAFLPGLGQDFRTSMNAIMGMTSIASNHIDDKKRVEDSLKKITDSSNALMEMVREFYGKSFETPQYDQFDMGTSILEGTYTIKDYSDKRIMLVEDNELNREIACEFLHETGVTIEEAETGLAALELFENHPEGYFDLIFMDISMPVMDGYEATIAIRSLKREDARKVPIVALSANALAEDVEAAKNAGMNEHISKPVDIDKLQSSLEKWIK